MEFIEVPNIPKSAVRLAVVDGRISNEAERKLLGMGIEIIKTVRHVKLYEAISCHPDIMIHHLGANNIIHAPETDESLLEQLSSYGFELIEGASSLGPYYPADIAYNVARVGGYYFHNMKYTDPLLFRALNNIGLEPIDIKQGYTKCSISIVDENAIITADVGIAKEAEKRGIEVLLIEPTQGILLPGLDYGFIGGSSGLLDRDIWAVYGDARKLVSFQSIYDFLAKKNIKILSLSEGNVMDLGGIIPLQCQYV